MEMTRNNRLWVIALIHILTLGLVLDHLLGNSDTSYDVIAAVNTHTHKRRRLSDASLQVTIIICTQLFALIKQTV